MFDTSNMHISSFIRAKYVYNLLLMLEPIDFNKTKASIMYVENTCIFIILCLASLIKRKVISSKMH